MMNGEKKLSIAFYWHMHQPVYQLNLASDYLMPWVRLHGVKDYLDMLLIMEEFDKLKLNFNLVPTLLDSLINYGKNGYHDIHSRLTITQIEDLTDDDMEFILNNFFEADFKSMIEPHKRYKQLYDKKNIYNDINSFSAQDYSDIMALFNLVWIDSYHIKNFPEIEKLLQKGENYSYEDRVAIIELHRKIIRMIIPKYKEYWDNGRIEISTSPYYHPILPIMLDVNSSQANLSTVDSTLSDLNLTEDAFAQTDLAINRIEEIFGKKPRGIWPPEQAINKQTLELFKQLGIEWTISDEGVLANSTGNDFVRDFKGHLEDPYFLTKVFKYKTHVEDENPYINLVFRDSVIPNLISFEYSSHDAKAAADDLYDRIKVIQSKIQTSPDKNHILVIALDGENCWESYKNDGIDFLKNIYSQIENDESLETVLIGDFVKKPKHQKYLKKIQPGSWINRNFQLWIGETVKNLAWTYLKQVKNDLYDFALKNPENKNIAYSRRELMVSEGSDWFWWYGEPNDSGQDHLFDYLFREHLKNAYRYLQMDYPKYLDLPLTSVFAKPTRYPQCKITPKIDGDAQNDSEWENAGSIDVPEGPILQDNKLFNKICYGADENNFYLRLYLSNKIGSDKYETNPILHQMYIYVRNGDNKKQALSPIRLINKTENISPIMREKFHNELRISMMDNKIYPMRFTKAIQAGLWAMQDTKNVRMEYKNVIDISIPFEIMEINRGEMLEFFFANANFGIKDAFSPQDILLNIVRP